MLEATIELELLTIELGKPLVILLVLLATALEGDMLPLPGLVVKDGLGILRDEFTLLVVLNEGTAVVLEISVVLFDALLDGRPDVLVKVDESMELLLEAVEKILPDLLADLLAEVENTLEVLLTALLDGRPDVREEVVNKPLLLLKALVEGRPETLDVVNGAVELLLRDTEGVEDADELDEVSLRGATYSIAEKVRNESGLGPSREFLT